LSESDARDPNSSEEMSDDARGQGRAGAPTADVPAARREADEVLGIAAHEINNALGPLAMTLQLCERRVTSGQEIAIDDLRFARAQVRRIAEMANELLDAVRIDSGQLPLRLAPIDLCSLVQTTVDTFRRASRRPVVCDLPPTPIMHTADGERLAAALVNYLDNATKYAPEHAPIEVRMSLAGERVRIAVTDHGPGVRPEDRERLFERYYRAPQTAASVSGLGLGLFICRAIAERHGGAAGVESQPGKGATFWIDLSLGQT
jgi:two-component system phosphate regulon sensor histidine kinase PhoR